MCSLTQLSLRISDANTFAIGRYQSSKDPSQVDYMRFSDEIESIFTRKDLEKTPTADVVQFVPPVDVDMCVLSPEEEQTLQKTMHRLAERVCLTTHIHHLHIHVHGCFLDIHEQ